MAIKQKTAEESAKEQLAKDMKDNPNDYFINPQGHPKDRIIINSSPDIPAEGALFGLNGYTFLAKPGLEIDIPRPVRLMLDTRITTVSVQGEDGKMHSREMPRITYTLVKEGVNEPVSA